jgi:hypothetical protein
MEFAKGEGADWRFALEDWIRKSLRHVVFNPNRESEKLLSRRLRNGSFRDLKRENLERFKAIVREMIDLDSREIAHRSDYVICYWDESAQRGAGTKGEIMIAKFVEKPVYLVTEMKPHDIPGWVLGCTTRIFASFDELKQFLLATYAARKESGTYGVSPRARPQSDH